MPENFEQPKPLSQRASDPKNIDLSQSEAKPDDKRGDVNRDKNEKNENILNLLELFWKKGGDEEAMEKATVMSKGMFAPKEIQEKVALIVKNSVYYRKSYEYCLRVKDCFNLDDSLFENAICSILISRLDSGEYEEVTRIRDSYGLPKHYLQEAIIKKVKELLTNHSYNKLIKLKEAFGVDDAVIKSPENVAMIKGEFLKFIDEVDYGSSSFIIDIQKLFNLPESFLTSSEVKERVVKKITRGIGKLTLRSDSILFLKNLAHLPDDVFQNSVMQGIINYLKSETAYSNEITILEEIKNAFNLSGLLRSSEELKEALKYRAKKAFMYGDYSEQIMMIKNFIGMTDEDFNTPEIRDALFKRMSDYIISDISSKEEPEEELESIGLSKLFSFGPELLHSSEMQEKIIKDVTSHGDRFWRSNRNIDYWIRLKELFLTEESINSSPMQSFVAEEAKFLTGNRNDIDSAIKLAHNFNLPSEVIKDIFLEIVIRLLENEESKAIELVANLNPSEDFYASQELKNIVLKKIAQRISAGNLTEAVTFQEKFRVDFEEVKDVAKGEAIKILSGGSIEDFLKIIEQFKIDPENIKQIDKDNSEKLSENNLIKFIPLLGGAEASKLLPLTLGKAQEMIFAKLAVDQDLADYFVENLDKYYQQPWVAENVTKAIQQYSVAQKFIYAVENDQTVYKNEAWVVDLLAKAKVIVEEHKKQFPQGDDEQGDSYGYSHGSQGFRESDPFANHPWRFGERQIRIASAISEMMAGKVNSQELEKLGINSNEISASLAEVNEKINTAYQNFLEQIRSNTSIKEDDKQAFLDPESSGVKMTPLLDNIRAFIARYFVQSAEGDVARLSEIGNLSGELDRILAEGFRRYIKIHEVDVPLYDKLYEEFDTLRETGRSPLEVYLGRDGIYAYIGRHSQDVARRRKLGLEGRKKLKEMGEVVEIHPQYTVYPRYFRDNLNQETKRQFLEQEGISPDADPLFYDTGYTGTIPEQIMKVMDFSQEDIEKRIRLLSAPSVHRRVKGIPENARSEIIEYIEHNAKTEETAEGLIIDKKTGKIRHIAKPTNPEEQFYFMMVKQAVARHYWLQEKLHHEPSGNVNLDSEHYTIRIRQEYAKLLPSDFMQNPKEFLTQHGEMLKGSKGEGEYPDEEVVLFKMTDGTEIVAKKIELRKAKEARKEFSILISAKKAGLPTAEPVGFLSGKEDTDGSYLLMKKIEGISGRNFDKYLRDSGKFTEEKIKSILQQVAQKNKEMAELFRTTLKIDKRWRIKDTIIELNEETGEVENVIPIDWERAQNFNPATPKEIDEIA